VAIAFLAEAPLVSATRPTSIATATLVAVPAGVRSPRRSGGRGWSAERALRGGRRSLVAKVEEQDLALSQRGEGHRALRRETGAITGGQDDVTEGCFAGHQMEPDASSGRELVNDVGPGIEQRRVHECVLVDDERPPATVGRADDTQSASPLRRAEALLLAAGLEVCLPGTQPDLEEVHGGGRRRIRLVVAKPSPGGHAAELASLDQPRAPQRIPPGEDARADEGDDLGVLRGVVGSAAARWEPRLVEDLERAETLGERIGSSAREEGEPGLPPAASIVVALLRPAEGDHVVSAAPARSRSDRAGG
jgi:hypothetical protein